MTLAATSVAPSRPVTDLAALSAFWLLFAMSSFVLYEPAPFDLFFIALFGLSMVLGLRIPNSIFPMMLTMVLFLIFGLIGTALGSRFSESLRHIAITGLLCAVSIFIACFIYRFRERGLRALLSGWVIAGVVASLLGILGYFHMLGGASEQFTLYFRAKGSFKDPNVLAPFIVVPMLYCFYEVLTRRGLMVLINLGFLAIMLLALLLTFSRGGWAHFLFSSMMAGTLWLAASKDGAFRTKLILFAIAGAIFGAVGFMFLLDVESIGNLFEIRAQVTQSYDSGASGRFAGQVLTIDKILENPLGLGALGFLPDWFEQPHNVYLFVFMTSGWFGGMAYLAMIALTLILGFKALSKPDNCGALLIILLSGFLGVVLEGIIVDTDHWRHFWINLGAVMGVYAMTQTTRQEQMHSPAPSPLSMETVAASPPAMRGSLD